MKEKEALQDGEGEHTGISLINSATKTVADPSTPVEKVNGISSTDSSITATKVPLKKANGIGHPEETQPSKSKVNGISEQKPLHRPSTKTTPIQKSPLRNGIKSSPSPSSQSAPRSPPIPIIPSPAPEVPSPTSIAELRARLAARISQARIARKAVGTSVAGAPQTRESILQARAKRKAKVEEKIRAKKAALKAAEQSGAVVKKEEDESSDDEIMDSGMSFGRVLVNDTEIDAGRGEIKSVKKKKGPSDVKGRLSHLLAKESRISKMDPEKASKVIENDRWHHALLSSKGEKVKDDTSLLKKTISKKEREKKKSKREWDERIARVEKGKEDRQRKREENIAKRREEKGAKKGGNKKVVKSKKPAMRKKRPGFEGGRMKIGRK